MVRAMLSGRGLVNTSYLRVVPILAIRVEPHDNNKIPTVMVDGEIVSTGIFQAEVIANHYNILICNAGEPQLAEC